MRRGLTLVEALIVAAVFAGLIVGVVFAGLAMMNAPNRRQSQRQEDERRAIQALHALGAAQDKYRATPYLQTYADNLDDLKSSLWSSDLNFLTKGPFVLTMHASNTENFHDYSIWLDPRDPGSALPHYYLDQEGTIRVNPRQRAYGLDEPAEHDGPIKE